MHSLYNQKKIDHKLFAFIPATNQEDGYFIIGGITDDKNYKYKGSLNVNSKYNTWGNTLKRISIGDEKYDIDVYAQIHSSHYDIVTSKRFFIFILNTVLKEDIMNKNCERLTEGFKKGMIEFNRTVIDLTVFNYEDSSISFYSDFTQIITSTNVTNTLMITKIYNISIIIMFISLIHLLSMKLGNYKMIHYTLW